MTRTVIVTEIQPDEIAPRYCGECPCLEMTSSGMGCGIVKELLGDKGLRRPSCLAQARVVVVLEVTGGVCR